MHGIEHREQERRTIRLSAPRWPFSPAPGSMLPGSPLAASARNRSLVTAFRSPATAAASRRPPFRGQSSQPATSLPSKYASVPVRPFGSTTASRFAPVAAVSLPLARCTSTTRFGLPRLRSPLPSGTFTSLGIKAFNRVCCLPVHLTNPPDFLSLPAARPNKSWGCGSSFQVRYVSAGLLFLKPLGTFFTMLPMCFSVNAFLREMAPFPQSLFDLFRISYSLAAVQVLWIIRASRKMFYFSLRIMPLSVASHRFCSSAPDRIARRATAR